MKIKLRFSLLGSVALLLLAAAPMQATTITLSSMSSDETPYQQLNATLDFQVAGSTLTLTVTNDTADPAAFNINELYFNATDDVTSLALVSAVKDGSSDVTAGWTLSTDESVAGFGTFDFGLTDGVGFDNANVVNPSGQVVFTLDIGGTGPFDMVDFVDRTSEPDGAFAAAKFVSCRGSECFEDDDSAFGKQNDPSFVLPEPGLSALVALALGGLVAIRRR